jgi:uncharacterized protein (UPF0264 family)
LVSVRNVAEAEEALAGGADWIDLKEPRRGALGHVDASVAQEVAAFVRERVPLSAAAGELAEWRASDARQLLRVPGLSYLKVGLANSAASQWQNQWRSVQREVAADAKRLTAVAYADFRTAQAPCPDDVLECAARAACEWLLIDTFDKSAGVLSDWLSQPQLAALLNRAREANCRTAIAGSLTCEALARLRGELVDMAAIRGAACRGSRDAAVCRQRVADAVRALSSVTLGHPSRGGAVSARF